MSPAEALQAFDGFKLALEEYISRLPGDERIIAREKQYEYAIGDKDYSLALRYISDLIEILFNKINSKHCI